MSIRRRPKIKGKANITVQVRLVESCDGEDFYKATGYVMHGGKKRSIGSISAYSTRKSKYLTVSLADLNDRWTGRGYGHVLYWSLAKKAKMLGLQGLRSDNFRRNCCSDGAWRKIKTYANSDFSYLKLS